MENFTGILILIACIVLMVFSAVSDMKKKENCKLTSPANFNNNAYQNNAGTLSHIFFAIPAFIGFSGNLWLMGPWLIAFTYFAQKSKQNKVKTLY